MPMIPIKKGARSSDVKIKINRNTKTMNISPGFLRKYAEYTNKAKYMRLGFDKENNEIGIEFLRENDESGELMKLTYTNSGSSISVPVRSLISIFSLEITNITGTYKDSAIDGPKSIENFAKNGFLLKINFKQEV